jgi:uncharacterized RDD family membrane protein YckC
MAERLAVPGLRSRVSPSHVSEGAGFGARVLAYLLDSLVLFAFLMLFAAVALLNVFLGSDSGRGDLSDGTVNASIAILLTSVPAWALVNSVLILKRGQTLGQYIIGLRLESEAGDSLRPRRLLYYWLALHPLLFHPVFAALWLLLAYWNATMEAILIPCTALAILCLAAPFASLIFALADPQNRAMHDRLAGVRVVYL